MQKLTTPGILLRKLAYGEFDFIITFLTRDIGKIGAIAKSARKSTKRFAGSLELFSHLEMVLTRRGREGLFYLQEVAIKKPFEGLRSSWLKVAYASYWGELVDRWSEKERKLESVFDLLLDVLSELERDDSQTEALSILFQMRFLGLIGVQPNLDKCLRCLRPLSQIQEMHLHFALEMGGVICNNCAHTSRSSLSLSKGCIKQLQWVQKGTLSQAARIRFSPSSIKEGLQLLEAFVPFHLGHTPQSLKVLQKTRPTAMAATGSSAGQRS
jgi:DNA repair protein RecO (recombination protein O)